MGLWASLAHHQRKHLWNYCRNAVSIKRVLLYSLGNKTKTRTITTIVIDNDNYNYYYRSYRCSYCGYYYYFFLLQLLSLQLTLPPSPPPPVAPLPPLPPIILTLFNCIGTFRNWSPSRHPTMHTRAKADDDNSILLHWENQWLTITTWFHFYYNGMILLPEWISNHLPSNVIDVITYNCWD